jgi:hypothetical protein
MSGRISVQGVEKGALSTKFYSEPEGKWLLGCLFLDTVKIVISGTFGTKSLPAILIFWIFELCN